MTYAGGLQGSLWGYMFIYDGCMTEYRIIYLGICCYMFTYDGYMRSMVAEGI